MESLRKKVGILEGNLAIESILQYFDVDPYEHYVVEETAGHNSRQVAKKIPKSPTVFFIINKNNKPAAISNKENEGDSDSSVTVPYDYNSDMSLSQLIQKDREMIEGNESSEEN